MGKKLRYMSPVKFQYKAAEAKGWDGIAEAIRNQIQENCNLMARKHTTPTKLVGFAMVVDRHDKSRKDLWQGDMLLRFNNNFLTKNVLRYNFQNAFRWQYDSKMSNFAHLGGDQLLRIRSWYGVYNQIKNLRHRGIYDFLNTKIVTVNVRFVPEKWPGMYYDELFDLIENSGGRRSLFGTVWEDHEQQKFDELMMKVIPN